MNSGEICENCKPILTALRDELEGQRAINRSSAQKIGKLRRDDPDKRLREHEQWKRGERLFGIWQRATGHMRSKWTVKRFRQCLPFLEIHEDEIICRGIEGIAYDPWVRRNKNGTAERVDGWGDLFRDDDTFERYCNKAPLDWKDNLIEHAEEVRARK